MGLREKIRSRVREPIERIGNLAIAAILIAVIALLAAVAHAR
jgi:hypothetical protein